MKNDERKPGRWWWRLMGRHYYADIGKLTLCVRVKGNKETGYQYAVWELFGRKHFGEDGRFQDDLDQTILLAERLAVSLAKSVIHITQKQKK